MDNDKHADRRRFLKIAACAGAGGMCSSALGAMPKNYDEPEATEELRNKALEGDMPRRPLGTTGEELTIVGFGGFHLLDVNQQKAEELLNFYLDAGGNFIETAIAYGNGESEQKIGRVMKDRREECFLSTKTPARTQTKAARHIQRSLDNLQTDRVDNLFMHNVSTHEDLDRIMASDGALRAAENARRRGEVRHISITSHDPHVLLRAVRSYPFDFIMEWINYYDYFNFPIIFDEILPECRQRDIGIISMKPVGDGLLYRPESAKKAFRWVWSQPDVTSAAAGNNTMYQLASNLALAKNYEPMGAAEKQKLYQEAPELSNYVCRRCGECVPNDLGLDIPRIFGLEAYYDRQMRPGPVMDLPDEWLRKRLSHWFHNEDYAKNEYSKLDTKVSEDTDASGIEPRCPYDLPINDKLHWVHKKLTGQA